MITKGKMARRVRLLLVVLALGGVAPVAVQAQYAEVADAPVAAASTTRAHADSAVAAEVIAPAARAVPAPPSAAPATRDHVVRRRWLAKSALLV